MDDLKTRIESAIADEKHDIEKYRELVDCAKQHGQCKVAGVLEDILNDEESHVNYLDYITHMLG